MDRSRAALGALANAARSCLAALMAPALWAGVRLPAPARLVVLSQSPAAMAIAALLLVSALLQLIMPLGVLAVFIAGLSWLGALGLGAMAIRSRLLQTRIDLLEEKVRGLERDLIRLHDAAEDRVVSRVRARDLRLDAAE
ncbi:MAG: hypothetical protein K2P80_11720 [Beijerinckiaceae bacterium]|nr:hypothetical protein [Beijerinckiaceae bacterium]